MSTITPTRTVEIYVSSSKLRKVINSSATTWGQLREEILKNTNISSSDLDSDNSKIFEGNQRVELVSLDTQLPTNIRLEGGATTNNLLIIVTPKQKVKSGVGQSRRDIIYDNIQALIAKYGKEARTFFGVYANKSSDYLEERIATFIASKKKKAIAKADFIIDEEPVRMSSSNGPVTPAYQHPGVTISQESLTILGSAFSLMTQAVELIKASGLSNLINITSSPDINRLDLIADRLQNGR